MTPRILLVEDTPDIALWLGTALRQGGMQVEFATDGHAADRFLQPGHGFDAVLLDLQLPGQDGLSVLQSLRGRGDAVPVLIKKYGPNGTDLAQMEAARVKLAMPKIVPDAGEPVFVPAPKVEPGAEAPAPAAEATPATEETAPAADAAVAVAEAPVAEEPKAE
jgi:CheY-like chemotaxis protein